MNENYLCETVRLILYNLLFLVNIIMLKENTENTIRHLYGTSCKKNDNNVI